MTGYPPRTLYQKIWDTHVVAELDEGLSLLYIDLHLVNEVTSPQAFSGLRAMGRDVRKPEKTIAVADHNVPTLDRSKGIFEVESRKQVEALERNVADFGVPYLELLGKRQGIVHVVGPELGLTLPGTTIVCGDSHTSTHGAFGALAFGIGTSEVEHVLATQSLPQPKSKNLLIQISGKPPIGISAKDMILYIIGRIGTAGATGHVIEYAGEAVEALDMAGRMTICNMSIEAGARAGLIAPDDVTFDYLAGRPHAPKGAEFDQAVLRWKSLRSDPGAVYDSRIDIDISGIAPMVTWGTTPEAVVSIDEVVPDPDILLDASAREQAWRMLGYMGLEPHRPVKGVGIDVAFIGSCTNARVEDLRAAAAILKGRKIASSVRALAVPGSTMVKHLAEAEGLHTIFVDAGFEWRESGCSMCLGMNPDRLRPKERCASTSNRNFEGRQGPEGRTHLMSPAMVAASAIEGRIADVRDYLS